MLTYYEDSEELVHEFRENLFACSNFKIAKFLLESYEKGSSKIENFNIADLLSITELKNSDLTNKESLKNLFKALEFLHTKGKYQ